MNRSLLALATTLLLPAAAQWATALGNTPLGSAPLRTPPTGIVWELQSLTEKGTPQALSNSLPRPTIVFDGRVAYGSTSCNTYRSSYVSRADIVRFGRPSSTRRACANALNARQTLFLRLLPNTARYAVSGNSLTLYSGSQDQLVFVARGRVAQGQVAPDLGMQPTNQQPTNQPKPSIRVVPLPARPVSPPPAPPKTALPKSTALPPVQPMLERPAPATAPLPSATTIFDSVTAKLSVNEQLLIVGPQETNCTGLIPQRCLLIKTPGEKSWRFFYSQIKGFAFRPGVTSLLRVRAERVANPPADAPGMTYSLLRVLGTQNTKK